VQNDATATHSCETVKSFLYSSLVFLIYNVLHVCNFVLFASDLNFVISKLFYCYVRSVL